MTLAQVEPSWNKPSDQLIDVQRRAGNEWLVNQTTDISSPDHVSRPAPLITTAWGHCLTCLHFGITHWGFHTNGWTSAKSNILFSISWYFLWLSTVPIFILWLCTPMWDSSSKCSSSCLLQTNIQHELTGHEQKMGLTYASLRGEFCLTMSGKNSGRPFLMSTMWRVLLNIWKINVWQIMYQEVIIYQTAKASVVTAQKCHYRYLWNGV